MRNHIFSDVKLTWAGTDYRVPANRIMGLILRIENVITLSELVHMAQKAQESGTVSFPMARVAQAYCEALNYAGADVTHEEVYAGLLLSEQSDTIATAIIGLQKLMIPPKVLDEKITSVQAAAVQTPVKKTLRKGIN